MTPLCASADLAPMQPRIVAHGDGSVILLRLPEGSAVGYRNACPHMGIELDWEAHRLISRDGRWLKCTGHGALFRPGDGLCVAGPCKGDALAPLRLREAEGQVFADG